MDTQNPPSEYVAPHARTPLVALIVSSLGTLALAFVLALAPAFAWPLALASAIVIAVIAWLQWRMVAAAARREAEASRTIAERRLALALRGGHKGLWETLEDGTTWFSPEFHARLGFTRHQLTGALDALRALVHPEDEGRWNEALAQHHREHEPVDLELRLATESGEHRWFRLRLELEVGAEGAPRRVAGALSDVTEYRYAEMRLRESEESFRSLSAASPVGILKAGASGQAVYVNERWQDLTQVSEFEAIGEGWLESIHDEDRERVQRRWFEFTGGGKQFDLEFRFRVGDEGVCWVRSRANAVLDELCAVAGYVVTIEDVTEAKTAAQALAEARDRAEQGAKAKSEFLANMSHEIRTPLNGVVGMTELLMGTTLDDEQRDFVRTINTSADALLAIINDILDFSKIEAGKMTIERVPMDVREIAEDVGDLVVSKVRERGLELVLAVGGEVPRHVLGDPTRVRQILINLASNAIKFTDKGEVIVGADRIVNDAGEARLKLYVRDSGIGIPSDRLGAVFESFTQADGSTTRKYGGTGLGLTICRQLAKLMGGSIHVSSEVGAGSVFWIELPLEAAPEQSTPFEVVCDLSGLRVLVVDDHALNRRILVERLRGWGARPVSAADGDEALQAVRLQGEDPFNVVLLDHRMPGLTGTEVAERLRDMPGAAQRVVVMLSSLGSIANTEERERIGVQAWLTKPVREAALHRALCSALGRTPGASKIASDAPQETFEDYAVLLVEDNEVNRKVALRMLDKLGVRADVAVNGIEAVQRVQERAYDVVFMDCQMPEMDGFEATREIRRREVASGEHVHICAMTANAMEGDRDRCIDAGMDDYVSKPVKQDRLREQLANARDRRRRAA